MKFKTIEEAENYFIGKISATNNMHGEEDNKMQNWIEEQEIDEVITESDIFELGKIVSRQGKEWVLKELEKYATDEEIESTEREKEKGE